MFDMSSQWKPKPRKKRRNKFVKICAQTASRSWFLLLELDELLMSLRTWVFLRTFAPIVSAHPYCARKFTCHVIHRAVEQMIGQMAIAIALLGFNDLRRSVTPTFLFRNRLNLQLSPHCPKMNKKSMWEVKKNSRFLSTRHGILPSFAAARRVKLWSLNANLLEPHQLTKFA